ncbi:MAG TPA: hypothetical protein DHW82_12190 [Spirochaetia bacterium]|nr:MAG: hypothetical protein A2Y41_03960 [Spirochaetes bacterium GWB1_36_13]HCL57750.1 hypothetical protein [Spirochaetia bacterium]
MKKLIGLILNILPFVMVALFNTVGNSSDFDLIRLKKAVAICFLPVLAVTVYQGIKEGLSYLKTALTVVFAFLFAALYLFPDTGILLSRNFMTVFYAGFFSAAFFPPLFKLPPFTYEFAKKTTPSSVWKLESFKKINMIINYIWAFIFAVCIGITLLPIPVDYALLQFLAPFLVIGTGFYLNKKLPVILNQKLDIEKPVFESVRAMLESMPFGLNREAAKGVDAVVQFIVSGNEDFSGYLVIKNQLCSYHEGVHEKPSCTIKTPSDIWLDVSSGKRNGTEAFLEKLFTVEGDGSFLLKMNELFGSKKTGKKKTGVIISEKEKKFAYQEMKSGQIQKILIIDGGHRGKKFSKTTLMATQFGLGAQTEGAEVETVFLKDKKIHACTGCYTCWTKTPGKCIFQDDMEELLVKTRNADLVVYATPLFVFSMTSTLKAYFDRIIPNLKPYLETQAGLTCHPRRYEDKKEQGMVVFSAAGFPEIERNFDSLSLTFKNINSHFNGSRLLGEFYLPCAEILSMPVFKDRLEKVKHACFEAGRQAVREGKIALQRIHEVREVPYDLNEFEKSANFFWKSMEGKASFYESAVPFEEGVVK